ncbi:Jacalin-related lectin 20 [Cardamine amara subsp. amara]|uniref:Jacalin-related lectin 20 n=1 Tax=Cardamine amara subsp. amara TaxID=228776 RepID=A0ABD1C4Y8_CARAN
MALKIEAKGGDGGNKWDDGCDYDDVTKIHVRGGLEGIQSIKFEYVKAGKTIDGPIHGVYGRGFTQTFEINHLQEEHLVSVKGWYNKTSGVIQALQFETNQRSSEVIGFDENNTKFTLEAGGNKLIGFHGSAETNLKSLGVYFVTLPPIKLQQQGGTGGMEWDHGVNTGVRKVFITYSPTMISHIKVDYDKAGKVEMGQAGRVDGETKEFVVDYPNECITSVGGTCDQVTDSANRVRTLSFKTSKGRTSPTYGNVPGKRAFVLESKGRALVGFHGRGAWAIDAIGAHFGPFPIPPPPAEKLQSKGGEGGGTSWDDGAFDGVRKIYVGQGENGVASVKFVYDKNNQVVLGEDHGKMTMLGYEEFELAYPNEYITAVEGCYDKIFGSESTVITMLKFETNVRTSPPFGLESTSSFVLKKEGHKVVGFHGSASHELHQFGVSVGPITK